MYEQSVAFGRANTWKRHTTALMQLAWVGETDRGLDTCHLKVPPSFRNFWGDFISPKLLGVCNFLMACAHFLTQTTQATTKFQKVNEVLGSFNPYRLGLTSATNVQT